MRDQNDIIEGRNAVLEALRSGQEVERVFVLKNSKDGPVMTIVREAKKRGIRTDFVSRDRLDSMSETGKHQGVFAYVAAYRYAGIEELFEKAEESGRPPFFILCDGITDPHNLGAIIRTANCSGAHGVIIPKHGASGLTSVVAKASAGAINYTPVCRVTNLSKTMEELKEKGLWFACADMAGDEMTKADLKGSIGLVIGNEGKGVSANVKKHCDFIVSIPMQGDIDSLNASVACGVLAYEIVRQRGLS